MFNANIRHYNKIKYQIENHYLYTLSNENEGVEDMKNKRSLRESKRKNSVTIILD